MNQGKLEVVKQEMARLNIDILEISELKWTGMGEFNSDDHYVYYCGQESLRRNGVAITANKESKMQYLDAISKMTEWSLLISRANHVISVIQVYAPTSTAEEQRLRIDLFSLTWKKELQGWYSGFEIIEEPRIFPYFNSVNLHLWLSYNDEKEN